MPPCVGRPPAGPHLVRTESQSSTSLASCFLCFWMLGISTWGGGSARAVSRGGPGLRGRERRVYLDCFSLRRSSRPRFTPHISKRQRPPEARRAGGKHAPRRCCTGGPRPPSPRRPRAATARGPAGSRPLRTSPASSFKRQAHVHPSGRRAHAGPALPSAGPQRTGTPPARGHRPAGRPLLLRAADPLSPQQGLLQLSRRLLQVLGERGQGQLFLEGRGRGAFHHHRPSCLDRRDAGAVSVPRLPGARGDSDVGTQHLRTQQVSAAAALRLPGRYRQLVECTPAQLWGQQTDRHLADGRGRETQDGAQFQKLLLELHSQIGS